MQRRLDNQHRSLRPVLLLAGLASLAVALLILQREVPPAASQSGLPAPRPHQVAVQVAKAPPFHLPSEGTSDPSAPTQVGALWHCGSLSSSVKVTFAPDVAIHDQDHAISTSSRPVERVELRYDAPLYTPAAYPNAPRSPPLSA